MNTPCAACGVTIPKNPGPGRPRKYCDGCRVSVRRPVPFTCIVCGVATAGRAGSKYCGVYCRRAARSVGPRVCMECGAPTPTSRHKHCSDECRLAHRRRYWRDKKRRQIHADVGVRQCAYCPRDFTWNQFGFKSRKFCTRKCSDNWRPMVEKPCDECGGTFLGRHHVNGAKRCPDCSELGPRRAAANRRRAAALRKIDRAAAGSMGSRWLIAGRCTICGDHYTHVATGPHVRRPSRPTCGRTVCDTTHAKNVRRIDRHNAKARRRTRMRSAFVAKVDPIEVHERCGWKCHLCGKPVRRDAVVPDALAPTIDHVVPLAQGGTHEPINCRTAHFLCNSMKGDELPEQLPLLGWAS